VKLRYTRPALSSLADILDYIAERSPEGARRVHARVLALTNLLTRRPLLGARTDEPGIRRMSATPYPYLIFYEATAEEVIVHSVRHAARDPSGSRRSD
jgi:toxin ParE1/3/4